jgi:hypothetical protein
VASAGHNTLDRCCYYFYKKLTVAAVDIEFRLTI